MTDPPPFPDPSPSDDELLSAVLDGETAADVADRVAADPRLAARLETLREVATAVAAPVPIDVDTADRHLTRARETWSSTGAGHRADGVEAASAPVVDLASRRRRVHLVGVAAAVVALALLVPVLVAVLGRSDGDLAETATGAPAASTADDAGRAAAEGSGGDGASVPTVEATSPGGTAGSAPSPPIDEPVDLGDLGAAPDAAALRARVDAALVERDAASSPVAPSTGPTAARAPTPDLATGGVPDDPPPDAPDRAGASAGCADPVASVTDVPSVRARAEGSVGELAVAVYVVDGVDGPEVVVADPTTCAVLTRLPL
jgi:hypothetical protein